ncbi:MAG TPA: hypothetical protein VFL69_15430 [Marmoricola sp.]|nr:hypothetical protein [Marmoricola sp.]
MLQIAWLRTWVVVASWVAGSRGEAEEERGDVPGWVLITVMTAGLVAGLWAIAGPQLSSMLRAALSSVHG